MKHAAPKLPRLALLLATTAMIGACKGTPAVTDAEVTKKAKAALAPFKTSLRDALVSAISTSPEAAIDVCQKRAPVLAREASREGITVGRSALKLRNRENAPRPWLGPVMDRLSKAPSESDAHEVVALPDGKRGYAEAIWLGPMCLLCHGESVTPEVEAKLRERYPGDAARGFRPGDFRGVFWAEIDAKALGAGR